MLRRLQVVGGDVVFGLPARRPEFVRSGIVAPVREGLERQERIGGASIAQVDLNGVRLPLPRWALRDDEVDPVASDDLLAGEAGADLERLGNNAILVEETLLVPPPRSTWSGGDERCCTTEQHAESPPEHSCAAERRAESPPTANSQPLAAAGHYPTALRENQWIPKSPRSW